MKVITVDRLRELIKRYGLANFFQTVMDDLDKTFLQWNQFEKTSRHATHFPHGVIELMPCSDNQFYSFKYVNGHPENPEQGKLTVVAVGMLAEVSSGYPLLLSEMTLLTAIRTAAVSALGAKYLARKDSANLGLIGTGAQAEFIVHAMMQQFSLKKVYYYDIDCAAMKKFYNNMDGLPIEFIGCATLSEVVAHADILVTATADKNKTVLVNTSMLHKGMHIHAMGGDCPGKTEFDANVLSHVKLVVEYLPQSLIEGEVQQGDASLVDAELWEVVAGLKSPRTNEDDVTFFDAVGFALEDFSILKTLYSLSNDMNIGEEISFVPDLKNPKDLYSLLR